MSASRHPSQRNDISSRNASHELRTPLTRERTLLQVALNDPTSSDMWESTGKELPASNREQESIIEALLALASSEGEVERRECIDVSVITHSVLRADHAEIDRVGIRVETTIAPAILEGDPDLIERLVANLIDNAVVHNVAGGTVHLLIGTREGRAVVSIANTGRVIPVTEVDRLFQPFQRLDDRRAGHKNGHGLGLSIVRAIATAHGATVTAQPGAQGGLRVEVAFPPPAQGSMPSTTM